MFDLAEINNKTNFKHVGDNAIIKRVICDSRKVQKGDLFIALKGNSVDATRFVPEAFAAGAAAACRHASAMERQTEPSGA